jgi:hypothetical protein
MGEIVFNSMQDMFNHIRSRGGANPATHGTLGTFYALMTMFTDPNTCSCKKGKAALANIMNSCKSISAMRDDVLSNCKNLFDNKIVIVKEGGTEIVRF